MPKWPSVGQSSGREPYRQNAGACERWRGRPSGTVAEPERPSARQGNLQSWREPQQSTATKSREAVCRQAPRAGAPEPWTGQDRSRTLERLTGGTALNQAPAFVDAERSSAGGTEERRAAERRRASSAKTPELCRAASGQAGRRSWSLELLTAVDAGVAEHTKRSKTGAAKWQRRRVPKLKSPAPDRPSGRTLVGLWPGALSTSAISRARERPSTKYNAGAHRVVTGLRWGHRPTNSS